MRLELHLSMDGDAFHADTHAARQESARILRDAAHRIEFGLPQLEVPIRLKDANGNRVGFALVTDTD